MPREVLENAAQAILDFNGSGLSLLEISHRSRAFQEIIDGARGLVKELWQLDDDYEVLFLGGGASTQFCMVAYNLLRPDGMATYLKTGVWAEKAAKEAALFGQVHVAASSEDKQYRYIPKQYDLPEKADYFHITTNNTIYGTQIHAPLPAALPYPIVADMSSDVFSRRIDAGRYGLIYAGAQKNMGPAGATMVVVRKSLLGHTGRAIPSMLDYRVHIKDGSMYNTPPVFAVYCCYLTLQWIKARGIEQIERENAEKAALLYAEIDRNSLFEGTVVAADRSLMNVCFVAKKPDIHHELFKKAAAAAGCEGLQGHRLVGGFRASLYNALDLEGVKVLVEVMKSFEARYGD